MRRCSECNLTMKKLMKKILYRIPSAALLLLLRHYNRHYDDGIRKLIMVSFSLNHYIIFSLVFGSIRPYIIMQSCFSIRGARRGTPSRTASSTRMRTRSLTQGGMRHESRVRLLRADSTYRLVRGWTEKLNWTGKPKPISRRHVNVTELRQCKIILI